MTDFVRCSVHTRKIDKRLCCDWCGMAIRKGETYAEIVGKSDGVFGHCRYCPSCLQFAAPGQAAQWGWYTGRRAEAQSAA
jgi:hypothetical protein